MSIILKLGLSHHRSVVAHIFGKNLLTTTPTWLYMALRYVVLRYSNFVIVVCVFKISLLSHAAWSGWSSQWKCPRYVTFMWGVWPVTTALELCTWPVSGIRMTSPRTLSASLTPRPVPSLAAYWAGAWEWSFHLLQVLARVVLQTYSSL